MKYLNLEQRMINMYRDTFPVFVPVTGEAVSERAQKQFYDFLKSIYQKLYNNPDLLFTTTHEDDAHTYRFNKSADKKPELTNNIRRIIKKMEDFLAALFTIGSAGQLNKNTLIVEGGIKINKTYLNILNTLGLNYSTEDNHKSFVHKEYDELFYGWKWLVTLPEATLVTFSRCMYDPNYSYSSDIYERLSGNETAFHKLIDFLEVNSYLRIDNRDNQVALDYVKNYDPKEQPVKDAWAERTHSGISVKYDPFVWKPMYFCLRMPKTKEIISKFDSMEDNLKDFIVKYNKECDSCRYCVQTDKTGKRELNFITVKKDKDYNLCLLFPGFYYCFTEIDEELCLNLIQCLSFIDKVLQA